MAHSSGEQSQYSSKQESISIVSKATEATDGYFLLLSVSEPTGGTLRPLKNKYVCFMKHF